MGSVTSLSIMGPTVQQHVSVEPKLIFGHVTHLDLPHKEQQHVSVEPKLIFWSGDPP